MNEIGEIEDLEPMRRAMAPDVITYLCVMIIVPQETSKGDKVPSLKSTYDHVLMSLVSKTMKQLQRCQTQNTQQAPSLTQPDNA